MSNKQKRSFSEVLPFDEWKQKTNPTEQQIALYHQLTAAIKVAETTDTPKKITATKRINQVNK